MKLYSDILNIGADPFLQAALGPVRASLTSSTRRWNSDWNVDVVADDRPDLDGRRRRARGG